MRNTCLLLASIVQDTALPENYRTLSSSTEFINVRTGFKCVNWTKGRYVQSTASGGAEKPWNTWHHWHQWWKHYNL